LHKTKLKSDFFEVVDISCCKYFLSLIFFIR
jgi:hypothetical protein